jgi:hypothetical protein
VLVANAVKNAAISLRSDGALLGAGGGSVTLAGLGAGSLATKSAVNWNTDLTNIPAFGNFAYISSITSENISTYISAAAIGAAYIANGAITNALIANAAITSAKIGNAAIGTANIIDANVTTLKVQNGAITAPGFASGNTNDLYLTYTLSGIAGENYSVFILGCMECSYQAPLNLYAGPSGGTLALVYRVVSPIGGTLAAKGVVITAPPGTYQIRLFSEDSRNINGSSIYVLATKR